MIKSYNIDSVRLLLESASKLAHGVSFYTVAVDPNRAHAIHSRMPASGLGLELSKEEVEQLARDLDAAVAPVVAAVVKKLLAKSQALMNELIDSPSTQATTNAGPVEHSGSYQQTSNHDKENDNVKAKGASD